MPLSSFVSNEGHAFIGNLTTNGLFRILQVLSESVIIIAATGERPPIRSPFVTVTHESLDSKRRSAKTRAHVALIYEPALSQHP